MIKKAKPLPVDLVIRYAHKISSDYGVCCPENWVPDNPKRPYPTDSDMRRGWLAQLNNPAIDPNKMEAESGSSGVVSSNQDQKPDFFRSNSKSNLKKFLL